MTRKPRRRLAALALVPALAAAATAPVPPEALDRARAAAKALGSDLMGTLLAELRAGGPARAVRVCAEVAQERTATFAQEGLSVRRVSLRVRNPVDRPDDYERAALERLAVAKEAGDLPEEIAARVEANGAARVRYLRPIVVAEPCLACHGPAESIAPEIRALLAERYPDDEATGYRVGDLRGAISVVVDLP